jgi:restriction endonuclease S subunit
MTRPSHWFGKLPDGWTTPKLSYVFRTISSGTTPDTTSSKYYDGDIPWVTTSELRETEIVGTQKLLTKEALRDHSALKLYPRGTLLIAMYGATIGRIGVLGIDATTNQACCAMANPIGITTKFAFYVLLAARPYILGLATGGGQPNVNQEVIRSIRVPLPGLERQCQIVHFLDNETGKIDMLLARIAGVDWQESVNTKEVGGMIGRLIERRAGIIIAAVTGQTQHSAPLSASEVPLFS